MSSQKIWDFWATKYDRLWVQKYSLYPTRREVISFLNKNLKKNKKYRILDVGCGIGQMLIEINDKFEGYDLELTGIDYSKCMIERAKKDNNTIKFKQLDVKDLNTLKYKYDYIICTHSFPYYQNRCEVLVQLKELLNDKGYLLLAQASQNTLYDYIALFFVKFTTGKAKYPSIKSILKMSQELFECEEAIKIKERFFMPSIILFVLRGIK